MQRLLILLVIHGIDSICTSGRGWRGRQAEIAKKDKKMKKMKKEIEALKQEVKDKEKEKLAALIAISDEHDAEIERLKENA